MPDKKNRPHTIDDALSQLDDALTGHIEAIGTYVSEKVNEGLDSVKSQMKNHTGDSANGSAGEKSFESMGDVAVEVMESIQGIAKQVSADAYAKITKEETWSAIADAGRGVLDEARAKVKENPWPLIGGVALGTFALGLFVGKRTSRSSNETPYRPQPTSDWGAEQLQAPQKNSPKNSPPTGDA